MHLSAVQAPACTCVQPPSLCMRTLFTPSSFCIPYPHPLHTPCLPFHIPITLHPLYTSPLHYSPHLPQDVEFMDSCVQKIIAARPKLIEAAALPPEVASHAIVWKKAMHMYEVCCNPPH